MRTLMALMLVLALAAGASAQGSGDPKDMAECIEQIRARGMSEGAWGAVAMIAGMRVGGSSMEFGKDESSGIYFTSFTGKRCALPNEDPAEAQRERMQYQYRLDAEISRLKPLADADGSGFVGTEEGMAFRKLCEFGYKASFVAKQENGDREKICRGLQADLGSAELEVFEAKLKEYEALRQQAAGSGITDLPEVALHE